jgi:hypothetical protein
MSGTLWNVRLASPAILRTVLVVLAGAIPYFTAPTAIAQNAAPKEAIATETRESTEERNSPTADSPRASSTQQVETISPTVSLLQPNRFQTAAAEAQHKETNSLTSSTASGTQTNLLHHNASLYELEGLTVADLEATTPVVMSNSLQAATADSPQVTGVIHADRPKLNPPSTSLAKGGTQKDGEEVPNLKLPDTSPPSVSVPTDINVLQQIENYTNESSVDVPLEQVTNVSQLRDVSPSDWAFEALRSLVERYGCIAGYPDRTFRGNRSMTRYEFAAGLNSCLQQMERLIQASGEGAATKKDLIAIQRLIEEFGPELAVLRGNIDALEARTTELEYTQFSTTTKLDGEVVLGLAGIFAGQNILFGEDIESVEIFGGRTRLSFETSFTGRDLLRTRLQAFGLSTFTSRTQTFEGNLAFADEDADNNIKIDALLYRFPIGKSTEVVIAANGGRAYDFANTLNYLDGDGAFGALSRFGTRNPLYYLVEGSGIGLRQQLGNTFELSLGYLAGDTGNPRGNGGLFGGSYGALAQLVYKPSSRFQIGFTYINSYNRETLTGSPFSNPRTFLRTIASQPVNINFQPPAPPPTPRFFPANQPIPPGEILPLGTQLPPGTRLNQATTLPFPVTIQRPPFPPITIQPGTTIPAGVTLPLAITLPLDLTLPVSITLPTDLTIPGAITPPPPAIAFNGTIGELLSQPNFAGVPLGYNLDIPIISNSYGVQLSWQVSDRFVLGGWVGYTVNTTLSTGNGLLSRGNVNTINGALTLAFPDLGKRGNLGGIIVGVEPFVLETDIQVTPTFANPTTLNPALIPGALALLNSTPVIRRTVDIFNNPDPNISLHVEAFYQMRLTDNISITPGVIWITAPGSLARNGDLVIGTIRTSFSF